MGPTGEHDKLRWVKYLVHNDIWFKDTLAELCGLEDAPTELAPETPTSGCIALVNSMRLARP